MAATGSAGDFNYGVYNDASSAPAMTNVTATASGGGSVGVVNSSSSPTITGSRLKGAVNSLGTVASDVVTELRQLTRGPSSDDDH